MEEDHCSNDIPISSRRVPGPMTKIWEEWLATEMGECHIRRLIRCPSGPFGFVRVDGHNFGCIIPKTDPVRRDKVPCKGLQYNVTFESTVGRGTTHTTHH